MKHELLLGPWHMQTSWEGNEIGSSSTGTPAGEAGPRGPAEELPWEVTGWGGGLCSTPLPMPGVEHAGSAAPVTTSRDEVQTPHSFRVPFLEYGAAVSSNRHSTYKWSLP